MVRPLPRDGSLVELYDTSWGIHPDPVVFAYCFTIRPGWAKGWGVHRRHDDRYALVRGTLEVVFYDERPDAAPERECRVVVEAPAFLSIPADVWHAERNPGAEDLLVVNFPTIVYDHGAPDKFRLPLGTDELPVELGPGWEQGW